MLFLTDNRWFVGKLAKFNSFRTQSATSSTVQSVTGFAELIVAPDNKDLSVSNASLKKSLD